MSVLFLTSAFSYLVPTAVAAYRDHSRKNAIFVINLLLGWTIVGWVVALVWACAGPPVVQRVDADGDERRPGGLKLQGRDPRLDR